MSETGIIGRILGMEKKFVGHRRIIGTTVPWIGTRDCKAIQYFFAMHYTKKCIEFRLFERLTTQSNDFSKDQMKTRCSNMFIGHKCNKIKVEEMI